jgi:hypothetical protein
MKKSKTNKPDIDPEDFLKDFKKIEEFMDSFNNLKLEEKSIKKFEMDARLIQKNLEEKYKDILPEDFKENPEEYLKNLDSEE